MERRDSDVDSTCQKGGERRVGLATLASWGVSSDVARDLHQHVLDVGIGNLGGPATEAQYQEFAECFKGRISDEQISALVSWHRGLRGA
jgi:hypothetical protein